MISMVSIACLVAAVGVFVLLTGVVLLIKRMRLAGAIIVLLGVGLISLPALAVLYAAIAMR